MERQQVRVVVPGGRLPARSPVQPLPNQSQQAAVPNPSLHQLHELLSDDGVEVPLDVRFEHVGDRTATDGPAHRIERVVGTASWTEPVGALQEILLVDGVEHLDRRPPRTRIIGRCERRWKLTFTSCSDTVIVAGMATRSRKIWRACASP